MLTDNILQIPFWNMTLVHKYIHKMFAYGMIKAYKTFPMYVHLHTSKQIIDNKCNSSLDVSPHRQEVM